MDDELQNICDQVQVVENKMQTHFLSGGKKEYTD